MQNTEDSFVDDNVMRKYLLGQLEDEPELVERMDERCITDAEFSERLDVLEDDILEQYIQGALSEADTLAVEQHFLVPPERQRKLRSLRLLLQHLASDSEETAEEDRGNNVSTHPGFLATLRSSRYLGGYALAAVVVLLAIPAAYLLLSKHPEQVAVNSGNSRIEGKPSVNAFPNGRPPAITAPPVYGEVTTLNLLQPGLTRGDVSLPRLKMSDGVKTVHVQMALTSTSPAAYKVQLQAAGQVLATQDVVAVTVPGGALLTFDLSANAFPMGECAFVVRQGSEGASYRFLVSRSAR